MQAVNFPRCAHAIDSLFEYNLVGRVNDHTFTMVKVENRTLDFHVHADSDEAFYVLEGTMELELRDRLISLEPGDFFVVPKGVEHRPVCQSPVTCLLVEREGTMTGENSPGTCRDRRQG